MYIMFFKVPPHNHLHIPFLKVLEYYKPGKLLHLHFTYATDAIRSSEFNTYTIQVPFASRIYATIDPLIVKYVLIDNFKNWEKGGEWRTIFEDLLGNGIFNADGFLWK